MIEGMKGRLRACATYPAMLLLLFVVLGALVRIQGLSEYAFGPDDSLALTEASYGNFHDMLEFNLTRNGHPLMRSIVPFFVMKFTDEPIVIRLGNLTAGVLSIITFYFLGKRYINGSAAAGLIMAFLAAFSPVTVATSQVIKPYPYLLLYLSLALIYLHRLTSQFRARDAYVFQLWNLLMFLTHHIAVVPVTAMHMVLFGIIIYRKKHRLLLHILPMAFLMYSLFVFYSVTQYLIPKSWIEETGASLKYFFTYSAPYYYAPHVLTEGSTHTYMWMAMYISGIIMAVLTRHFLIISIFLLSVLLVAALHTMNLYPFDNAPRNSFLLPFIWLFITIFGMFLHKKLLHVKGCTCYRHVNACTFFLFGVLALYVCNNVLISNSYRDVKGYDVWHFLMTKKEYANLFKKMEQHASDDAIVILQHHLYHSFFVHALKAKNEKKITPVLAGIPANGVSYFYKHNRHYGNYIDTLRHIHEYRDLRKVGNIIFPSIQGHTHHYAKEIKVTWRTLWQKKIRNGRKVVLLAASGKEVYEYLHTLPHWNRDDVTALQKFDSPTYWDMFRRHLGYLRKRVFGEN